MPEKIGPYTVVSQLGRGGMGVVYKCRDEALNRFVAIKVLTDNLTDDQTFLQRFVREAQAAASLSHPNVVQIYFIGHDESDHPYFVMEYVSGRSLDQILRSEGRVDDPRASQLILQAAHGLAAAHDLGIIHRDIKPANLMLDDRGLVKIADFGLALPVDAESRLTATGMFVGTPGYISPEQCSGEKADHRTDIYALGVTYYTLLTGTQPFRGESPLALMKQILDANPPDVTTINPNVNPESRRILAKMIAKDREQRYQSCHELVVDLENLLPQMGVRSMTAGLATRVPTAASSSPAAVAAMSAPTAIIAGGASSPGATAAGDAPTMIPTAVPMPAPTQAGATIPDTPFVAAPTSPEMQPMAAMQPPVAKKGMSTRTVLIAALLAFVLLAGGAIAAVMYGTKLFNSFRSTPIEAEAKRDATVPASKDAPQEALLSEAITPASLLTTDTASQQRAASASTVPPTQQEPSPQATRNTAAQSVAQPSVRESVPVQAREAAPARTPQRRALSGVAVAAMGDEAILGAVSSVLRNEAESAGLEAVDAHSLPSTEDMLRGRASLRELISQLRDDGYAVLMLARIEPTGQRQLSYYGRTDTSYSARITVTSYDLATGRPFGSPKTGDIRYTSINASSEAEDVVTPLARSVAEGVRARQ